MTREPDEELIAHLLEQFIESVGPISDEVRYAFIAGARAAQAMTRELADSYCATDSQDCLGAEFRAEIGRLQTRVADLEQFDSHKLFMENEWLRVEIERLRAALSFYGDYLSYGRGKIRFEGERPKVMKDNGKQARAALEPKP